MLNLLLSTTIRVHEARTRLVDYARSKAQQIRDEPDAGYTTEQVVVTAVVRPPHRPPPRQGASSAGLWRWRRRDDEGAASIELVLAAPVLVLLLMLIVQFAVWAHATHIAQAAANEAAQAGRLYRHLRVTPTQPARSCSTSRPGPFWPTPRSRSAARRRP